MIELHHDIQINKLDQSHIPGDNMSIINAVIPGTMVYMLHMPSIPTWTTENILVVVIITRPPSLMTMMTLLQMSLLMLTNKNQLEH